MTNKNPLLLRCAWAGNEPLNIQYHDQEWGTPVHDDQKFFEMLILEGAQAGLSWFTILKRREGYRKAFCDFDVQKVAELGEKEVERLLTDPGIIRNKRKILSAIKNAQAFMQIQKEFGSFDAYVWRFVGNVPLRHVIHNSIETPVKTVEAEKLSKDLLQRGFSFVGPTICYAFMQATGLVNDHQTSCFRSQEL